MDREKIHAVSRANQYGLKARASRRLYPAICGAAPRAADLSEDHGMVDEAKLHQFVGQILSDLGAAYSIALVRMGDTLGLYKTLHAKGPMTVGELASAAGVNERYLREWLSHQAASNYLAYDP
jgi:hypothetical protein